MTLRIADCGLRTPHQQAEDRRPKSAIHNPQSAIGFTLIEIVVVLAILGMTAAAVVPAFVRATRNDPIAHVARQVENVLSEARETALTRAVRVRVTIVPETAGYWVRLESGTGGSTLDSGVFTLSRGIRLHSPVLRPAMAFDPQGIADADSLLILGSSGTVVLITDRWTGEAHAQVR